MVAAIILGMILINPFYSAPTPQDFKILIKTQINETEEWAGTATDRPITNTENIAELKATTRRQQQITEQTRNWTDITTQEKETGSPNHLSSEDCSEDQETYYQLYRREFSKMQLIAIVYWTMTLLSLIYATSLRQFYQFKSHFSCIIQDIYEQYT